MAKVIISEFLAREGLKLHQKAPQATKSFISQQRGLKTKPHTSKTAHNKRLRNPVETCFLQWCNEESTKLKNEGLYKPRRSPILPNVQAPHIMFADQPHKLLNFTSYDYLGLANEPEVIMAYVRGLAKQGAQEPELRLTNGIKDWTQKLESMIARFHDKEECFSYASVSEVLSALFYSVYGDNGIVLADEYNTILHRGQTQVQKYKHMDIDDLARKLHENRNCRRKVIVTDGVFSQTGEVTPLRAILELASEAGATVLLNDTHGVGCLGEGLRGTESHAGIEGLHDNLLVTCELGYGLGQIVGGYMVGSAKTLRDQISGLTSHPMYTVDLSAATSAAVSTIFRKLPHYEAPAAATRARSLFLRDSLRELGLCVKGGDHPIVSITVGKAKMAREFAEMLKDRGHVVSVITDPQLLLGDTHVRFILTSAHTDSHVTALIDDVSCALDRMRQRCGVSQQ